MLATGGEFQFESLEPAFAEAGGRLAGADELARAHAEATAIRAAAHAEGLAEGRAAASAAAQPVLEALVAVADDVRAQGLAAAEALELRAAALALTLAEKVVAGALAARPELVVEAVRGALRGVVERERITILVNPEDLALVQEALDGLRVELGGIEHCDVQAERRVGRGGAIVRHAHGDVDARVESKLERARELVFEAVGAAPAA
jgi:flagellar assembly protein FliH